MQRLSQQPICPVCGADCVPRELQEMEGDLVELKRSKQFQEGDKVEVFRYGEWCKDFFISHYMHDDYWLVKHKYMLHLDRGQLYKTEHIRLMQSVMRREQGKARTLSDLLALAKERGYSPGWA
jgi:hypothetical protein